MTTTGRVVTARLQIAWDGSTYTDETAYLVNARGEYKLAAPGSAIMSPRGIVNSMTLTLLNVKDAVTGRRFSPLNASGPLYAYIAGGQTYHKPVTFDVKIDAARGCGCLRALSKSPKRVCPPHRARAPSASNVARLTSSCYNSKSARHRQNSSPTMTAA